MLSNELIKELLAPVKDDLLNSFREIIRQEIVANKSNEEEKLLSIDATCKLFDPAISRQSVRNWTKAGKLKSYQIGARIMYKHSEILAAAQELKRYKKAPLEKGAVSLTLPRKAKSISAKVDIETKEEGSTINPLNWGTTEAPGQNPLDWL